jgi:diacylglycerol O-acyltransferase
MDIERAGNTDLAFLAMDTAGSPEQFAAVLKLDRRLDAVVAERILADRVAAVPRLTQRLVRTPPGCGRPVWVGDPAFDTRRQTTRLRCPAPGDERALVNVAVSLVATPLRRDRPLWRATFVDGLADGTSAVILVLHHVLADGLGGLAVLANLIDQPGRRPPVAIPGRPPTAAQLAGDAMRGRMNALRRVPQGWRLLRRSMSAGGGLAPQRAAPCSLLQPTGMRRQAVTAHADVDRLRAVAHRHGGTVNAALVAAVTGALHRLLDARGESIADLSVALPVAGRPSAQAGRLGNQVSPLLISVPVRGDTGERIARIADAVRRRRELATGPPPIGLLGPVFRIAAALGGYRWYMNRQRRLHTLVSYVRGPEQPVRFAGIGIDALLPVSVGENGNLTVTFQAISYAGTVTVTAVADPDRCPDLGFLAQALQGELDVLCAAGSRPSSAS